MEPTRSNDVPSKRVSLIAIVGCPRTTICYLGPYLFIEKIGITLLEQLNSQLGRAGQGREGKGRAWQGRVG